MRRDAGVWLTIRAALECTHWRKSRWPFFAQFDTSTGQMLSWGSSHLTISTWPWFTAPLMAAIHWRWLLRGVGSADAAHSKTCRCPPGWSMQKLLRSWKARQLLRLARRCPSQKADNAVCRVSKSGPYHSSSLAGDAGLLLMKLTDVDVAHGSINIRCSTRGHSISSN